MKKTVYSFLTIIVLLLIIIVLQNNSVENNNVMGSNFFSNPNNGSTSTTSYLPAMVLNENANRHYASIQNDSDTIVYLYLGNFASQSDASTTDMSSNGFRLLPNAANKFIIDDNSLYTGQVWATSTAANKKIIYIEK